MGDFSGAASYGAEHCSGDALGANEYLSRLALIQADAYISDRAITPIVVTLLTAEESQKITIGETVKSTGLARGTVHGGLKALVEAGLVAETTESRLGIQGGRNPLIFSPTEALHAVAAEKLEWRNAIELRRISQETGISEQAALSLALTSYRQSWNSLSGAIKLLRSKRHR